jgi:competence protein ComEC
MTTVVAPPSTVATARIRRAELRPWQAPLVPVALAASAGIIVDRTLAVPLPISLAAAIACLLAFVLHRAGPRHRLGLLYLWSGCAALGCAYHHGYRDGAAANNIRHWATEDGRPIRLRGLVESQPTVTRGNGAGPRRTFAKGDRTRFVLRVTEAEDLATRTWQPASGRVQVNVGGAVAGVQGGDGVELPGRLSLPEPAANPGGFDYASFCRDRQLSALVVVGDARDVMALGRAATWSPSAWLAVVRGWGQEVLTGSLPAPQGDLATALLLGDSPNMTQDDWDVYLHTGVIHVLAISGQHLVVLAGFLWLALRLLRVRRRYGAPLVALLLLVYALVVGGRPPVMRSAWVVLAYSGGVLLRRPTQPANTFALAWLGVLLVNPTDVFNAGCQLSFLAVAVLVWGIPEPAPKDALEQIVASARPWPLAMLHDVGRAVGMAYVVNLLVWIAVAPLVASYSHLISPIALLIGPPLVLLTSIALLAGFAVLLLAPLAGPLAWPFAFAVRWSLAGCSGLAELGADLRGAYFYVPDVPAWWLWLFYAALMIGLASGVVRQYWRTAFGVAIGCLGLGLFVLFLPHRPGEFRCSFLAVGHGGCAVIETPSGDVLLYDAGSAAGGDVTRRHIAPFLWSRGIRRIDDVIFSHADLDHFNGLPELLARFPVARVTCTPTFGQRDMDAMRHVMADVEWRGIPVRIVTVGDRWQVGSLSLEALHPPRIGPEGKENARSLVLHLLYRELSILLTGDLEDAGLAQVLAQPPRKIDVLMAPHHGSARSNTPALVRWTAPRVVVMCQGRSDNTAATVKAFAETRSTVYGTWPHGTVTVRSDDGRSWAETFRTGVRCPLSARSP